MSNTIKACRCGHNGELLGIDHGTHLSLTCPKCNKSVGAFSPRGLIEHWNAAQIIPLSECIDGEVQA